MCVFVLVHGGWHGGWCWDHVSPRLEAAGHRVLAPDLPAHGGDFTPLAERPWERYGESIADLVGTIQQPVILVGHSSGGMVISEVSRQGLGNIAVLVYLSAFLLPEGVTPREVIGEGSGPSLMDALDVDPTAGVMTIRPDLVRDVFYHDCTDADAEWAIARLRPEPLVPPAPNDRRLRVPSAEPDIPRIYIETVDDRALPIAVQRKMHEAVPCQQVFSLPTSHSPFISAPDQLAALLASIAQTYCE